MKALKIVLVFAVVLLSNTAVGQDTMYIHQNVGGVLKLAVNNIDSVIFYDASASTATNDSTVTDIEGNSYQTVTIGTQVWMKENLNTKKYNDSTAIPLVTDNTAWDSQTTGGYCYYNNYDFAYENIYGALYNWHAVNTGKLCPTGWHVPADAEWNTLRFYIEANGESSTTIAYPLKSTSGWPDNGNGTDIYGFTALPGGSRYYSAGFIGVTTAAGWGSATADSSEAYRSKGVLMRSDYHSLGHLTTWKNHGLSIRCLKD
jgi:uncharacterized protein (TIGR02145 family)